MQHAPEVQRILDTEHLRLLRVGFFVSAATTAFFSLLGLFYAALGVFVGVMNEKLPKDSYHGSEPPESVGWVFLAFGLAFMLITGTIAGLKLWAARCLRRRTSHTFCVVMSILACLEIPYGTVLGVLSFVVLSRMSIKEQFGQHTPA